MRDFFRSILDSFETRHTPSTQSTPPSVFENTTGAHLLHQHLIQYVVFRGLTAILMRNGPSNIIFFSFRDHLRDSLPESMDRLGLLVRISCCLSL